MLAPNINTVCGYVHIGDRVTTMELDLLFIILNLIWTITNLDFFSILALSSWVLVSLYERRFSSRRDFKSLSYISQYFQIYALSSVS